VLTAEHAFQYAQLRQLLSNNFKGKKRKTKVKAVPATGTAFCLCLEDSVKPGGLKGITTT
jgi:hypothetical protein